MARPKLSSPHQPWPLRWVLRFYEFCASLQLAVVLIACSATVLAVATFVESSLGLSAVHFGIYGTWWFVALHALLALNIFCAAAIRYPWKRYQTGFVITHIGLLTLLFGCLLTYLGGIDAQMPIFQEGTEYRAYEKDSEFFELAIYPQAGSNASDSRENAAAGATTAAVRPVSTSDAASEIEVFRVPERRPFAAGPFNWDDYGTNWLPRPGGQEGRLARLPWSLAHRDQGVLYDQDGIRLEVLDFYADSREVAAPQVTVALTSPRPPRMDADGRQRPAPPQWVPTTLAVTPARADERADRPYGVGAAESLGGGRIVFWLAGSEAERDAFLHSAPQGPVGESGQVVVFARGEAFAVDVAERLDQGRYALGETGVEVELAGYFPAAMRKRDAEPGRFALENAPGDLGVRLPAVEFHTFVDGQPAGRLVLVADLPELNVQDHEHEIYGSYWFDHGEISSEELLQGRGSSRIDIIQGPDQQLYYRYWNRRELVLAAPLPVDGTPVDAFKMPIAQLQLRVDEQVAAERPGRVVLPRPFEKQPEMRDKERAARVRLTVDGHAREFWLRQTPPEALDWFPSTLARQVVQGEGRSVSISLQQKQVDVGFRVRLRQFERRLDPGTNQAAHYGSLIDLVDRDDPDRVLAAAQRISMNAPIDFANPATGRSYRLFQESFRGPFTPNDFIYRRLEERYGALPEMLYLSVLTVNYDPGRGVKYVGCLLVVAGIVTMFYMRAYFFKPKSPAAAERPAETLAAV